MKKTAIVLVGCLICLRLQAADPKQSATALFEAVRAGDSATVEALLKGGADIHARNSISDTPLMAAALNADAALVEQLLKAGADVNAINQVGATALMRAALLYGVLCSLR